MTEFRIVYQNTSVDAPKGEFLIGRSGVCHLVLDDPSVSRIHVAIINDGQHLYVEDRGSRNGVLVNNALTRERLKLKDGDQISVGHQMIQIVSKDRMKKADRTVGLHQCESCGSWVSSKEPSCTHCGATLDITMVKSGQRETKVDGYNVDSEGETALRREPILMKARLALKAIKVAKYDQAEQLIANALGALDAKLSDDEFYAIADAMVALAEASKSEKQISQLFTLLRNTERLISRELVEKLYDTVRRVGYRACPEMARYLGYLDSKASRFSPGERFIHRRFQGLVKLCS